jgi:septum formation protein
MYLPPLILASQSPRRRDLLINAGFDVEIISQHSDESYPNFLHPHQIAGFLAEKKNDTITLGDHQKVLVTADTIVVLGDAILNKPSDQDEARSMLRKLSGNTHLVYTGMCIRKASIKRIFTEKTAVTFKYLTDEFINHYLQLQVSLDKAGGYGIQDTMGFFGIKSISGCFYNVMGLPLSRFYDEIQILSNKVILSKQSDS